jgi:CheY-like chemotaxis protein
MSNDNPAAVLVVDDQDVVREPIAASLQDAGYNALCAADGREALTLIRARRPRLILLDLNMPGMGGLDVLRAMREMPAEFHAGVIMLTSYADRGRIAEAAQLGVRDYLLKRTFTFALLLERVGRYLPLAPAPPAAGLGPGDLDALMRPPYAAADVAVWSARDATFSAFDPVEAALASLARRVQVENRLPLAPREWDGYQALVVSARGPAAPGIGPADAAKSLAHRPGGPAPCLWVSPRRQELTPPAPPTVVVARGTVSLDDLATFAGSRAA